MKIIEVDKGTFKELYNGLKSSKNAIIKCGDKVMTISDYKVEISAGRSKGKGSGQRLGEVSASKNEMKLPASGMEDSDDTKTRSMLQSKPPMSTKMMQLMEEMNRSGQCMYCFCLTGQRHSHFLSKCPRLSKICRRCLLEVPNGRHSSCPAKDSIPHNRCICYFCGLDSEIHPEGMFGKPSCRMWGNDRLMVMGLYFWKFRYEQLKIKPPVERIDAQGSLGYAYFFDWFFDINPVTYDRNYVDFLLSCFELLKL